MAMIINGIFGGNLPWILIIFGVLIGIVVELLGISSLPFAIGLYLPFSLSAPIMMGGLVAGLIALSTKDKEHENEKGVLFSSGLVAGDALMGIIIAMLASITIKSKTIAAWITLRPQIPETGWENLLGFILFLGLTIILIIAIKSGRKPQGG
jgi:uncharacterized oligopeptide transporter (OPT) family protein